MRNIDERKLSIIIFSLFFSWLLAFPFEGQVLYVISNKYNILVHNMVFGAMIFHSMGLVLSGFFIRSIKAAKRFIIKSIIFCIVGTTIFFFSPSMLWIISLSIMAFLSGVSVAAWGYYFKRYTLPNERIKTAADVLIYSNILMIIINIVTVNISYYLGLALSILMLFGGLFFTRTLPVENETNRVSNTIELFNVRMHMKSLGFLYLFIAVITINSGLMYQVINPAFQHHEFLISWYWAVPYITSLFIMKNLPRDTNRSYILYIAIAMIGFCFISFMILDRSALSYFIVNTLMLGACGIYDLFWWSILGEMLSLDNNPSRILGIGLSANVLGVLIGGVIGNKITSSNIQLHDISLLAFGVILVVFMILPILHKQLLSLLKEHAYLSTSQQIPEEKTKESNDNFQISHILTQRENEIASLLLHGRTYKMIAEELYLSENTVKTHIKNIYSKLNVSSKTEFINLLTLTQKR